MPNSVFVSSKHCSIAQRTPLSHTKRRNGALMGALLREYQYRGWAPSVRLMSDHTAVVGCPALHSLIRLRANSYVMGPLVHLRALRALPQSPHASLMPPFVVCQGVHGLVAPTKHARSIPDGPDAVDGYTETDASGPSTPGDGPPTICPAPVAVVYPALVRSGASC